MAPKDRKNKAEEPKKAEEPAAKKAKADEPKKADEPAVEKVAEVPKFQEPDAPASSKPTLKERIGFATADTSLNVIPAAGGKVLTCLTDGGMSCLLAGARANAGQKAGRYMFEAKILQVTDPHQGQQKAARMTVRIGVSTSDSSLLMGEDVSSIYFDSEGFAVSAKKRVNFKGGQFGKGQVVAAVLNLDASSPNANTIALYRDGAAVGEPIPLPEELKGKPLFPHVVFRKSSVQVNFGPTAVKDLPFKCRLLQDASNSDMTVSASKDPKDGKYEVVMPIAFPDQGTFAWLDEFLKENPKYTELSDRAILQWAEKSGIYRTKGYGWKNCNDRPGWDFGLRELDDSSIKNLASTIAPLLNCDYVKMEVRGNLMKCDREKAVAEFEGSGVKKIALVVMGEPPAAFKAKVHASLLEQKRDVAEADAQKEFDRSQKEKEVAKREKAKKDQEEKKDDGEEKKDEAEEEPDAEETIDLVIAKAREAVELTEAEKEQWFSKPGKDEGDLTFKDLSASFGSFTIPTKEEGFDEIRYIWKGEEACSSFLKQWILEQKMTQRVEELEPGSFFKEQMSEWHHLMQGWKQRENDWKDNRNRPHTRQNGDIKKDAEKKEEKTEEAIEEKPEKKEGNDKDMKEGGEGDESKEDDKEEKAEEEEEKAKDEDKKEKADEAAAIITEDLDVWAIQDVNDVGNGEPLFANFAYEDWSLLGLRFELHLLAHAFKKDVNDPERTSFHENHLIFYHNKYFRKDCNPKWYGCSTSTALLDMLKDTIELNQKGVLEPMLSEDTPLDNFVKLTEDERRERQRRIDSGDESAALNIMRPPPRSNDQGRGSGYKGSYNDRGASKGKGDHGGNRGSYNDRGGSSHQDRGHSDRGGYSSRAPPSQPSYSRGQPPAAPARYSSSDGRSSGGYGDRSGSGGGQGGGSYGGHKDSGRDAGRYGGSAPLPPPPRGGGSGYHASPAPPASSYSGGGSYGGAQKRSYPPPSNMPPAKTSRVESRGPPPSRGSYSSHGGHSSGGQRR